MKIITYNVNGLRAAVSKGLPEWLVQENPDILCLQETKLHPDQYPAEVFEDVYKRQLLNNAISSLQPASSFVVSKMIGSPCNFG